MSKNEITTIDEKQLINVLQSSLYVGAKEESIKMIIEYCKAAKLDIMQKPVHIVSMWNSKAGCMVDVVMPGIGLYRIQAHRDGCAGISDPEFGPIIKMDFPEESAYNTFKKKIENFPAISLNVPEWCRVTVKKIVNGKFCEFSAIERWEENYATAGKDRLQPNAMWIKRKFGQLAKCAEAQALRKAHPEAVGNQPTAEEMEGKTLDMGQAEIVQKEKPECPPELLEDAKNEAQIGTDQFRAYWKALSKENRELLSQHLTSLQSICKEADIKPLIDTSADVDFVDSYNEVENGTEN